jgi:hypothetical protein
MSPDVATILGEAFVRGCQAIGEGLCAIAVALKPGLGPNGCEHPQELRDYSEATMGRIRWTCQCGHVYDAQADRARAS